MNELIAGGVGILIGAIGTGGWWYWIGHKHGLESAAKTVETATSLAYAAANHAVTAAAGAVQGVAAKA